MSQSVLFNGVVYTIPDVGDDNYGQNLTDYFTAIPSGALQKTGGAFTLTADANFGATYGLVSSYFKSRTASIASAGQLRLARADVISWRNQLGSANLDLGVDSSNRLTFNGSPFIPTSALTASRALVSDAFGVISVSTVTSTQLALLSGLTGTILTDSNSVNVANKSLYDASTAIVDEIAPTKRLIFSVGGNTTGVTGTFLTAITADRTWSLPNASTQLAGNDDAAVLSNKTITSAANSISLSAASITSGTLATARGGTNLDTSGSTGLALVTAGTWSVGALSGDISTSGLVTTIGALKVTNAMLAGSIAYSKLTLTGTILNADLAGSIAASKLVGSDIATVGTVTTGTWSATAISAAKGGTAIDTSGSSGIPSIAAGTWSVGNLTGDVTTSARVATLAATSNGTLVTLSAATGVAVHGTNTNDSASAGYVGEAITVNGPTGGTATPGSTGAYVNVASVTLTPGDWDVTASLVANCGATLTGTSIFGGISKSTAAMDTLGSGGFVTVYASALPQSAGYYIPVPRRRITVSSAGSITLYLVGAVTYSVLGGTLWSADSYMIARRVR